VAARASAHRAPAKYALDTNLFIHGYRDAAGATALKRFHTLFAPFEYLSAVVVQEFRAGLRTPRDVARFERTVVDPFRRRGRLVTPSFAVWQRSGAVLARLVAEDGLPLRDVPKRVVNDILIALSCGEVGVTVVTENTRDFARLRRLCVFHCTAPWPDPPEP
jgi:predicted nucleic acid-binding protein